MAELSLVLVPDEQLRQKSKPVKDLDKRTVRLILDMTETLKKQKDPSGVGLAAIQVGVAKRIFLMKPEKKITVIINPEILEKREAKPDKKRKGKELLEGCLSVPEYYGQVKRASAVKLKYETVDLEELRKGKVRVEKKISWFGRVEARIVQHEVDHLRGGLFVDEIIKQGKKLYRVCNNQWEEVVLI